MSALDFLAVMREYASVQRGEHPAWEGDRCLNGDTFLCRLANDLPDDAAELAGDLDANTQDYSTETGLSPDRIRYAANRLRCKGGAA